MVLAAVLAAAQLSACGRYAEIETAVCPDVGSAQETAAGQSGSGAGESGSGAEESGSGAGENGNQTQAAEPQTQVNAAPAGAESEPESLMLQAESSEQPAAQGEDDQAFFRQSGMSKEEAAAFVATFLEAVKADNREAVAGMITYPRKVKTPAGESTAGSAEEFLACYDEIFTADFKARLGSASASDLFCKNGLIGLGDGSVWFFPATMEDDMGISTINVSEDRYVRYDGPSGVQPG